MICFFFLFAQFKPYNFITIIHLLSHYCFSVFPKLRGRNTIKKKKRNYSTMTEVNHQTNQTNLKKCYLTVNNFMMKQTEPLKRKIKNIIRYNVRKMFKYMFTKSCVDRAEDISFFMYHLNTVTNQFVLF